MRCNVASPLAEMNEMLKIMKTVHSSHSLCFLDSFFLIFSGGVSLALLPFHGEHAHFP